MTAYADTSALLKLYIDEDGSEQAWDLLGKGVVSTCRITWAEARAALARRERDLPAAPTWETARRALTDGWSAMHGIDVTQALVVSAGKLAEAFALRGYDAVQLAAGHALLLAMQEPVTFVSFDRRLNRAARVLGLGIPDSALM